MIKYNVAPWKSEYKEDCKDKSVSCDCCPVVIDTLSPEFNLACGDSFDIFNSNIEVDIFGQIRLEAQSDCGLNVIVTANGIETSLEIPSVNDPSFPGNVQTIIFKGVTNIRIMCTSNIGGNCLGSANLKIMERCIPTST
ncbi:S-Ena type endospore appendage [Chengkuizengella sediminis]|uniref:S-Ena type endospore appendage n=1 Tax=Chengkuizengella sediminis TaxID=1885917 RepID=UPI00138A15A5|nr:S-Ena type endospore appendage [Chengkuizengella sediminis]NDI37131.1 hypothetical protein [Chengkuizengella sediminis]